MINKNIIALGLFAVLFSACGGSGSGGDDNIPEPQDTVLAVADSYDTKENESLTITNYLNNDTFTDGKVEITVEANSTENGTIVKSNNQFIYTPAADFFGTDTFSYTICSTLVANTCSTATITITVEEATSTGGTGNSGSFTIPADILDYYDDIDFTLTGSDLREELATTIISTHTNNLTYTPDVWNVLKQADLDPTDASKVLLIYGYDDNDGNQKTDRTRDKNNNGGNSGDWNREHVYPRSLGDPNLGSSGPGSDAHHLRASDVGFNSDRGSKKFATGSGTAGNSSGGWYPGDEWKGDVARMMMYMYLRYGDQCLPKNVAIGSVAGTDANMIALLLEWNSEDPVNDFEKNRNEKIFDAQGNRNPFIDNPYLATVIWGGTNAENTWN